jgi:L-aspartate oxidase
MARTAAPAAVRRALDAAVGVLRTRAGLLRALGSLRARRDAPAELGLMVALAALHRSESRGGHQRSDCPAADPAQAVPRCWTRAQALEAAAALAVRAGRRAAA